MAAGWYKEVSGYPRETHDASGFRATRKLWFAWADRNLIRAAFKSFPPPVYPYTDNHWARVTSIAIEPFGKQEGLTGYPAMGDYEYGIATVQYGSPQIGDPQPYPQATNAAKHVNPQAMISETLEPYSEGRPMPAANFVWASDNDPIREAETPIDIVHRNTYVLTRYNLYSVPTWVLDLEGKINDAVVTPILMPTIPFALHTLLFSAPQIQLTADDQGGTQFNVTVRFLHKEETWRQFWRSDTQAYDSLKVKSTGLAYDKPEEADFKVCFP